MMKVSVSTVTVRVPLNEPPAPARPAEPDAPAPEPDVPAVDPPFPPRAPAPADPAAPPVPAPSSFGNPKLRAPHPQSSRSPIVHPRRITRDTPGLWHVEAPIKSSV